MSDMTSAVAIDLLDNLIGMVDDNQENDYDSALHMAINALKAQADGDTISRKATIDAMEGVDWYHIDSDGQLVHGANSKEGEPLYKAEDVYKVLNDMPSAQPKRTQERTETHGVCLDTVDRQATRSCETCEAFNKTRLLISQPQQRWIPCSKELPERNLVVLVTTKWGEVTEGVKLSGNAWFIGRGEDNAFDSDILAWMPKPEPYKGVKNG